MPRGELTHQLTGATAPPLSFYGAPDGAFWLAPCLTEQLFVYCCVLLKVAGGIAHGYDNSLLFRLVYPVDFRVVFDQQLSVSAIDIRSSFSLRTAVGQIFQ